MRSFILLCAIGFLSSLASAQNFEVISSFPENGAVGVNSDSILISFSQPVYLDINKDFEESGFFAFVEPNESFDFDSVALDNAGTTVKFYGTFQDDTDYLLYILGAYSQSEEFLSEPFILQFTTADTRGEYVLRGYIDADHVLESGFEDLTGFTALLSKNAPEFHFYEREDGGDTQNARKTKAIPFNSPAITEDYDDERGDEIIPVYATIVDANTGEFEITGIREGIYFPLGYNLFEIYEAEALDEYEMRFMPATFRYDADGDLGIDSLTFDATTAPTDTISGIELTLLDIEPYTISEAFARVSDTNYLDTMELLGGSAWYTYHSNDHNFKSVRNPELTEMYEPLFGLSAVWEVYTYDSSKDSIAILAVTPTGVDFIQFLGSDEIEEIDNLSDLKPLPTYIDSDSAAGIMLENGLAGFINQVEYEFGNFDYGWDFELILFHDYWSYPPDPTPNAPVVWHGALYAYAFDYYEGRYYEAEYNIFLDPTTGDVLFDIATEIPDEPTISLIDYTLPDENFNPVRDSLVFVFDGQLDLNLDAMNPEDMGINLFIMPEDSLVISGFLYQEGDGGSTVTVYVELTADTDYLVVLEDVRGAQGESLDQTYILQFTTGNASNRFTISGYLETPEIDVNNYFKNVAVMLLDEAPEFGFDFLGEDDDESDAVQDGHEDEEDDFIPLYAANVDPESGYFEISLIREGDYYPVAFDISDDSMGEENNEFYVPKIFYYDPNEDRFPDILEINSTVAPNDTLSDLELAALKFERFTLSEAIYLAAKRFNALELGEVEFAGGSSDWEIFDFDDYSFDNGKFKMPKAIVADHDDGPMRDPFIFDADGRNFFWQIYAYHPAKDSAIATLVTPIGAIIEGFIGEDEIEEPIEFDDLKMLPEGYIDSDSAAILFNEYGGADFVEFLKETYEPGSYSWSVEIQALHEFWRYPFNPSPDAPVTWKAFFESYAYDYQNDINYTDSLVIYFDVLTGELLFSELYVNNETEMDMPEQIKLGQNYPNPFNPSTNIPFELSKSAVVNIEVFNLLGQKIATLTNELYSAGRHTIAWNASNYSSGIYFYRLTTGDVIQTKKLMLIK